MIIFLVFFFFFKQKTAYEIRPCDWSSDVCSSDLVSAKRRWSPPQKRADALLGFRGWHERGRSEERRVGKECTVLCRSRVWADHEKKKKGLLQKLQLRQGSSKDDGEGFGVVIVDRIFFFSSRRRHTR